MKWHLAMGGSFYRKNQQNYQSQSTESIIHNAYRHSTGHIKQGGSTYVVDTFVLCPELYARTLNRIGKQATTVQILKDSADEVQFLIQACNSINCNNITIEPLTPSTVINKRRKRQQKRPLYRYHVLEVVNTVYASSETGGDHSSPRTHLRRGHMREYKPGKYCWVRPSVVNPDSKDGIVLKDYTVRSNTQTNDTQY